MEIIAAPNNGSVGAFPSSCQATTAPAFPPEKTDVPVGEVMKTVAKATEKREEMTRAFENIIQVAEVKRVSSRERR